MATIGNIANEESASSVRTKLNLAIAEANKVDDRVDNQEIQNTISRGKAYELDGVDDYISLGTSTQLDLGTGDGNYFCRFKNDGNDGIRNILFDSYDATTEDRVRFEVSNLGIISGYIAENGTALQVIGTTDIGADGLIHSMAFTIERESATGLKLYLDGKSDATPVTSVGLSGSIASTGNKLIGIAYTGANLPFKGSIYDFKYFNCALSAAEIKALSDGGPTPFKYKGASNTALTSGTLTVGKAYLIKTYVASDDFTNVGAASNAAGVTFIATGTTPTTWTNSSNLIQIGEVLSLDQAGMSDDTWYDQSGNGIDGTVNGAVLTQPEVTNVKNLNVSGNVGIETTSPTARLHLPAGTAAANTAPIKIDAGTLATTPVSGNIESDGTHLYWTNSSGTRIQLDN